MSELFNAADIVGKTLTAIKDVPVYRWAEDNTLPIGTVKRGQPVGVVYSWLNPSPQNNRAGLWWVFYQNNNQYYYTPHCENCFSISDLKQQGVISTDEKIKQELEKQKLAEMSLPEQLLHKYGWWLAVPVLLFAAPGIITALRKK